MGTAVVYWHQAMKYGSGGRVPMIVEPAISRVTVSTNNSTATSSANAPQNADVAVVVPDEDMYFHVHSADDTDAAANTDKTATADNEREIACNPGHPISFLDVS